ncbi:MAG TPA: hypothetical protein PKC45_18205 [Gemmatales bacterium]|nr:hypothetical protein [Gemmatales bacterium]
MNLKPFSSVALTLLVGLGLLAGGCAEQKQADKPAAKKGTEVAEKKGHDHSGWWCNEHGIPEDECSMCSDKVAKDCKAKGDWCEKHDRAKSQCFICDPSLKEKFAAKYRAKYGKEPPPIEDEGKKEEKKDDKKGS